MRDIHFLYGAADEDNIWFSSFELGDLFKYNCTEKNIQFVSKFDIESNASECLFSKIIKYNQYIILLPQNAFQIIIYDVKTKEVHMLEIDCEKQGIGYGTSGYVVSKDRIISLPGYYGLEPIIINFNDFSIQNLCGFEKNIKLYCNLNEKWNLCAGTELPSSDKYFFSFPYMTNNFLKCSFDGKLIETYMLDEEDLIERYFYENEDVFWVILSNKNYLYRINFQNGKISTNKVYCEDTAGFLVKGKELLLISKKGGCIYRFHNDKFEKIEWNNKQLSELLCENDKWFSQGTVFNNKLILYPHLNNSYLVTIDLENGFAEYNKTYEILEESAKLQLIKNITERYNCLNEDMFMLEDFLKGIFL